MTVEQQQKQFLELIKVLLQKVPSQDIIETTCHLILTLPKDKKHLMVENLMKVLEMNPSEAEYRTRMSKIYKELKMI